MGDQKSLPFLYQFMAGGIAGISEIAAMYPLDVVKTRFQLQVVSAPGVAGGEVAYTSILDCLKKIVRDEGIGRLYRGVVPPVLVEAPKRATKFAANEQYKIIYKDLFNVQELNKPLTLLTGVSAGVTEAFIVVPFDLVKVRLQDKNSSKFYDGTLDCVKKILKAEGPLAFFNGLEATMWRHGTWTGSYFASIHSIKAALPKAKSSNETLMLNFVAGTLGGTLGTLINCPFDVVKSRIQNQLSGQTKKYFWTIPSTFLIVKEEGFKAIYKGFAPKVLRLGPGGGILLVVFEFVSAFIRKNVLKE